MRSQARSTALCGLLAALLACLPMAALAEAPIDKGVIDAFSDTWVNEGHEGYAAEIWYEDGAFHCRGTRFIAADEGYSFEFERCAYDAQAGALICSAKISPIRSGCRDRGSGSEISIPQ